MPVSELSFKNMITKKEKAFFYLSSFLLPNIFLFFLYNENRENTQIVFRQVLILAIILGVISAIGLLLNRLIIRNYEGASSVLLLFWSCFWLFEAIHSITNRIIESRSVLLATIMGIVLCVMVILRFISGNFYKSRIIFNAMAGIICLIFAFNFFPSVLSNIIKSPRIGAEQTDFYIMKEFIIDDTLPSPNIYWFHMDGMINFTDMMHFFDEMQNDLSQQLTQRGFLINKDAHFATHSTTFAVLALMSPAFYDSYLGELLAENSRELRDVRSSSLHDAFRRDNISFVDLAAHNELFNAFLQNGYRHAMISSLSYDVYVPLDFFYRLGTNYASAPLTVGSILELENNFLQSAHELIELLTASTPIPSGIASTLLDSQFEWEAIPEYNEEINHLTANTRDLRHERQLYRSLIDSFTIEEPRLTYITLMFTHATSWHWQCDDLEESSEYRIDLYLVAHEYAGNVMINMIDMILEQDSDAVIVLQADHGFHTRPTQMQLLADGFTEEEVANLHNSVMSAVRIPEQYGSLDEPLHPLNITRELVNRFVGENYQLLPE